MYFLSLIFFCYVKDLSTDTLGGQVSEERVLDLNEEENIILNVIRYEH